MAVPLRGTLGAGWVARPSRPGSHAPRRTPGLSSPAALPRAWLTPRGRGCCGSGQEGRRVSRATCRLGRDSGGVTWPPGAGRKRWLSETRAPAGPPGRCRPRVPRLFSSSWSCGRLGWWLLPARPSMWARRCPTAASAALGSALEPSWPWQCAVAWLAPGLLSGAGSWFPRPPRACWAACRVGRRPSCTRAWAPLAARPSRGSLVPASEGPVSGLGARRRQEHVSFTSPPCSRPVRIFPAAPGSPWAPLSSLPRPRRL